MTTNIARDGNQFISDERGELDNPILLILKEKGYELSMSFHLDVACWRWERWHAVGHGWKHTGTTPAELLSRVIVAETRGKEWPKRCHEPDLVKRIRSEALDQTDPETRHQSRAARRARECETLCYTVELTFPQCLYPAMESSL